MEELHHTAETYFKAGSKDMKRAAKEFYEAMDYNGDGEIGLHEFLAFMKQQGCTYLSNRSIFSQLCTINDHLKTESLGFPQVLTLFYIINSGRPICDGCDDLIKGIFFTCVTCFDSNSFYVCPDCFRNRLYQHNSSHEFLDNFALLRLKRSHFRANAPWTEVPVGIVDHVSTSQAIVIADPSRRRKYSWKEVVRGAAAGLAASTLCSIM